ncbi:unnamed protein product [Prunus armeniaca]
MEGCVDNYNDMEEIRRMLRQLTERIARIEARIQIGKSSDGERCVNPYLNRVARIDTLSHGSLDREYEEDSPFHYCASLCESSEEGHSYSHCVFEGDICLLKQLLNDNPSLLYQLTPRENTAFHIAMQFGHTKVVAEIYSRCRSFLTQQNLDGDTPLHVAARVGCFSIFNDLVREIPSMSQTDFRNENNGMFETLRMGNRGSNTVLHEAVKNGHIKLVQFLLIIDPKLASVENDAGESPLYLAARGGMFEILNQILKSTASSAHGGSDGQTA